MAMAGHRLKAEQVVACGPLQLCAGQEGGCEAVVHTMHLAFKDEGILLVDTTNAFNIQSTGRQLFIILVLYVHQLLKSYAIHIKLLFAV